MSMKIEGNRITMTRGDTLTVQVSILVYGEEYTPVAGDAVRFALKRSKMDSTKSEYVDKRPLIRKDLDETLVLRLEPEDTKPLGFGTYDYDIQITFAEDGVVSTFITDQIILTREVE